MTADSASSRGPAVKKNVLLAIAVGASLAGIVDLLMACIQEGWDIPLYIGAGLLGRQAINGGIGTHILSVFLHFFIAFSRATAYYLASRRPPFLTEYLLVCSLWFRCVGRALHEPCRFPLSGLHATGSLTLRYLIEELLSHMIVIGRFPIAFDVLRHGTFLMLVCEIWAEGKPMRGDSARDLDDVLVRMQQRLENGPVVAVRQVGGLHHRDERQAA